MRFAPPYKSSHGQQVVKSGASEVRGSAGVAGRFEHDVKLGISAHRDLHGHKPGVGGGWLIFGYVTQQTIIQYAVPT